MNRAGLLIQFRMPVTFDREGDWYVSHCPALDVSSQGRTIEEARRALAEAVSAFVLSCYERGTLDEVLKEAGFRSLPSSDTDPHDAALEGEDIIEVPVPFFLARDGGECRA